MGSQAPRPPALTLSVQVILGGGRKYMFPKGTPDPEYPADATQNGIRIDNRNLVQEWQEKHQVMGAPVHRGRAGTRVGLLAVGLWPEAGSASPRVAGMCGTESSSCRRRRTPL